MLRKLLATSDDLAPLIARLTLGLIILPHGLQKLVGLFGGYGFSATMNQFTSGGMPAALAFLVIIGESFGALGLIFGFIGRFSAFGIALIMLGGIFMAHLPNGLFMNWSGQQAGEGFEYHLLAIGLGLIVLIKGSGRWSIDRLLSKT
ncbi:MAG: DoxX family protein [Acidobacteriota bacterium]